MKRSFLIIGFIGIFSLAGGQNASAQFLGNPIDYSGRGTFSLGVSGTYGLSDWEMVSLTTKGGLARLTFGIDNGFDIYVFGGERDFLLTENFLGLKDVYFPFSYAAGAGVRLRLAHPPSGLFSLNALAEGSYFNPQTSFDSAVPGSPAGTLRRSYVLLEGLAPQVGISAVFHQSGLDAFVGVLARYHHYETKRKDWLISPGSTRLVKDESSIQETPVQMVLSLGIEFKLPYNYRISFEFQNSSLSYFTAMVGISQIGAP